MQPKRSTLVLNVRVTPDLDRAIRRFAAAHALTRPTAARFALAYFFASPRLLVPPKLRPTVEEAARSGNSFARILLQAQTRKRRCSTTHTLSFKDRRHDHSRTH